MRDITILSEHATIAEAFEAIDRLSAQMVRTGAPSDAVELLVLDDAGLEVRAAAHALTGLPAGEPASPPQFSLA